MRWRTVIGWILALFMIGAIVFVWLSASSSPVDSVYKFLAAVDRQDASAAGEFTWVPPGSPPPNEQWRKLFAGPLKGLKFGYNRTPLSVAPTQSDTSIIKITLLTRGYTEGGSPLEQDVQFPMRKQDGVWKVDVTRLARYPRLWTELPN